MTIETAKTWLSWAAQPIPHGGAPYCQPEVIEAERIVAAHEGRAVEAFAARYEGEK